MSEAIWRETQNITAETDTDILAEMYENVEPLSQDELALFAGLVTLPQAIAAQPAFDSFVQRDDAAYARPPAFESSMQSTEPVLKGAHILPAFTSSMQSAEPAINGAPAFSSSVQPNEPTFQNVDIKYQS